MKIKNMVPRQAYHKGYDRGRATGRRKGLEEAARAIVLHTGNDQLEMRLSGATEDDFLHLLKTL